MKKKTKQTFREFHGTKKAAKKAMAAPPTDKQIKFLRRLGADKETIAGLNQGQASEPQ